MSAVVFLSADERWLVARFDQALNPYVLDLPGSQWDRGRNAWRWRASERTALDLVARLKRYDDVEYTDAVRDMIAAAHMREVAQVYKVDDDVPEIESGWYIGPPMPHWIHQRRAFHFARNLTAAGIYIGMGGGKSRVAVDLCHDSDDERVLIICPKNVIGVWPKQFELYGDGRYGVAAPTKGTVAKRVEAIAAQLMSATGPMVVIVNYDSAWRPAMSKFLLSQSWDRVILDESHRVKSPGGKASRFVGQLSRHAKRRLCLTGTPMPHTPLDVYGQYRFLDPGIFGTNHTVFRNRYAIMGGYATPNPVTGVMEPREIVGWQNEPELAERTYSIAYRIADEELDEILGLEEPLHEVREATLSTKAQKLYDAMYGDFVADVGSGVIVADNALVHLLRLAQITSGYLPVDEGDGERRYEVFDEAKYEALLDLLEDIPPGEPVVCFARFTHDLDVIERAAAKLERPHGELSGRRRDGLADDSTLAEGLDIVGVQMRSGGEGVDFSRARYCVFLSVGYSLGDYEQALKRTHRPGQRHRVTYYHIVARGTVDETVYRALRERRDVIDYVLGLAS